MLTACSKLVDNKFEISSANTNYLRFVDRIAKRCEVLMRVPTLNHAIFQNGSIHRHSRITKVYLHSEFSEFSAFYHVGFNGSEIV